MSLVVVNPYAAMPGVVSLISTSTTSDAPVTVLSRPDTSTPGFSALVAFSGMGGWMTTSEPGVVTTGASLVPLIVTVITADAVLPPPSCMV